jgi:spermidine synthase
MRVRTAEETPMPHDMLALNDPVSRATTGRGDLRLTALSIIFVVSGFCGLIYESIWSHYLKLFVGHAAYAQTVVLIVFIGGMAIGAALIGRVAQRISSPLLVYAAVEGAVGLISLLFHNVFVSATEWGYATLLPAACAPETPCLAQWALGAILILPQSILLGTTFPLMTAGILRLAPRNPGSSIALFYFLNSIGAVAGVLASAFVLIPALGLPGALFTAGLLNLAVALSAYLCRKGTGARSAVRMEPVPAAEDTPRFRRILLAVAALTGLSSFIYEIVWIRMLSLVVGASTDAFELMLAAFILGLALGGLWVRKRIDRFSDLVCTLAIVQVLMGIAAVVTLPLYDRTFDLLAWLIGSLGRSSGGYVLYNVASHGIALLVMLPATLLAGMTLPLITTVLLRGRQGEGAIGFVYASNTVGAIIGVIIAVHFALPLLGLKGALMLGAAIDVGLALLLFAWHREQMPWRVAVGWSLGGAAALGAVAVLVPVNPERIASGVYRHGLAQLPPNMSVIFHRDGKTASIDVVETAESTSIRTNGKSDAAISPDPKKPTSDEYTMAFTAVLPLSLRPKAEHAAVIGFGSGMTTNTLLGSPHLKRVDTIEIEPQMVEGARLFGPAVERAYNDPRSRIIIDDAKSYFARSPLRYDIVISEPSNPWVSGVASLFTVDFYRRVRRQLTDGGVFVQWIQAYEFSNALLATILRALDEEFVDYAVYAVNDGDMMIVAGNAKLPPVSDAFTRFPDLRPTLERLTMASVQEIEVRRLAGPSTVRALLSQVAPGVNSDYYPLVDLGAPKERYLRTQARALLDLPTAPVPIVEMLELRLPLSPSGIVPADTSNQRRDAVVVAAASASWLVSGTAVEGSPPMPKDIGLLRAALWSCSTLQPRVKFRDLMYDVAVYVNPHLPHEASGKVWSALRAAPCANRMTPEDRAWLDLFEAVGARDAERMARTGSTLAQAPGELRANLRAYAVLAGATGMIAAGKPQQAAEFLGRVKDKLSAQTLDDPMMLTLRGYAARRP